MSSSKNSTRCDRVKFGLLDCFASPRAGLIRRKPIAIMLCPGLLHSTRAEHERIRQRPSHPQNHRTGDARAITRPGPGLLESAYERCLCHEFDQNALGYMRQVGLLLHDDGIRLECSYRADLIVANAVILELKSVEHIVPLREGQLLTYLLLSQCRIALMLNFNTLLLKDGISKRVP